jgi:hypothetical protein
MTTTKVISDRFRVPSLWATWLREHLVPVSDVLRRAGLPVSFFQQEKIYVTTTELFALWHTIGETSTVELNEAAFLLDHEDSHSFFRAFHRWESTSPVEWRTRHRQVSSALVHQ